MLTPVTVNDRGITGVLDMILSINRLARPFMSNVVAGEANK